MGLVKSSSKAGSFQAQPRPWWSEKAPSPLDPGFLCNAGRTEQCLEFTGSVIRTCSCGPARSEIRTEWQEPQVCPWLPGCRQRKSSSLCLWVPHPTVGHPGLLSAPSGPSCPDLPSSVLSWASLWRCQVPTLVFPAWRPAQLPGDTCHHGPEPKHCLLPGQPPQSGSLPGPQVGPRSPESSGKLAETARSSVRPTGNAAQDT